MIDDDLTQLRQLLARVAVASGMPRRELERGIGISSGALAQIADSDFDVKVEHLANLARLLGIPPGDLLALGCPRTTAAARHRLAHWLGPADAASTASTASAGAPSTGASAPPSPKELAAMVRAAVREELAARKGR
jgi:transcriptional regulator with XRE-family HTH domain